MRELIDCHVHTACCGHASGSVDQVVGAAVFAGLSGIVLTEHLPLPSDLDPAREVSPCEEDFTAYAHDVLVISERVRGLDVVLGAEADWLPGREQESSAVRRMATELGVKVLLGSVHMLDAWTFDDPNRVEEWDSRDVDAVWTRYFEVWCDAARRGGFDVLAHPDLVKKFGHRPSMDLRELYEGAARAAADGGAMIEVSTAGLRKPVGEMYPGPELLKAFRQAGVDATVGSDAHSPAEVGRDIDLAYAALHEAGYQRAAFPMGSGEVRWIEL